MFRLRGFCVVFAVAAMALSAAAVWGDDARQLRQTVQQRLRAIEAEKRALDLERRNAQFGSSLWHRLGDVSRALDQETSALRRADGELAWGRADRARAQLDDYQRRRQATASAQRRLAEERARSLQFGSSDWWATRRAANAYSREQSARTPFGREYVAGLEAQMRAVEQRMRSLQFGSSDWWAARRQLQALQRARDEARRLGAR